MTGPVQVLVVGFDDQPTSGAVLSELTRLGDAGVVRLVDVLFVARAQDGGLEVQPPPPGMDPGLGRLAAALLGEPQAGSDGAVRTEPDPSSWSLDEAVGPGGFAAVALIEHAWAQPLVLAIGEAGGWLLDETWLSADDRELLDRLGGETP